jgi:uncharacterized RDD family membrane protein YckC
LASYVETVPVAATAYGRFSGRVRAFVVDWIIIVLLLVVVLFVAVSADSDRIGRILGFTFVAVWLLYEPVLVSLTGSTVGHYLSNLRVVDDRTHGNVSFLKAVARLVIKTALGLYSFVTMATTLRHQAVHDLLTRSTVQIRDRSKAGPGEYVVESTELLKPGMPSVGRRILVIVAYLGGVFAVAAPVLYGIEGAGLLSAACLDHNRCSLGENLVINGIGLLMVGAWVVCVIQGWRGRLFGARRQPEPHNV